VGRDFDSIHPDRTSGDGIAVDMPDREVAIFSHGHTPMSLFDPADGRILEVNDAWIDKYGYSREEARAMCVQDVSAEPQATTDAVRDAEETGGGVVAVRWHRDKGGKVFPVEVTSGSLRLGGKLLLYAVLHDIESRISSERRLQQSESRFRALVEHLPIGVVVHREGRVLYANPGMRALLGLSATEEIVGSSIFEIVDPNYMEEVRERIAAVAARGIPTPPLENTIVDRSGALVPVEVTGIPFEFDGEPAVLAMMLDLRKRKEIEARLMLADRLASLGRLAASVGHEINNPLAYVLGNIELLERELEGVESVDPELHARLRERLSVLEEGALRVRDIVRDLKTLTGGEPEKVQGTDLHRVLDICANMAEHEIRTRATLVRDYGDRVAISASEQRLSQIFLNLLVNAAQSIPEGNSADNEVRIATRRLAADRVEVTVSDTGSGIADVHRERIFEPFFTTKATGGSGLGLSICHSIVSGIGGTIDAEPVAPRGTCFRVVLPCDERS
jgi:two-component system, NtrC family, sensor kinase